MSPSKYVTASDASRHGVAVGFQLFLSVGIDAESQPNELSELLDGHLEACKPCIAKDVILIPVVALTRSSVNAAPTDRFELHAPAVIPVAEESKTRAVI